MSYLSALRSGVGLVTAFVPESLVSAYAACTPEAMWVAWPETPDGSLALEGQHLLLARWKRATALVIGPGLGREPETLALVNDTGPGGRGRGRRHGAATDPPHKVHGSVRGSSTSCAQALPPMTSLRSRLRVDRASPGKIPTSRRRWTRP